MKRLFLFVLAAVSADADDIVLECRSPRDAAVEARLRVDHLEVQSAVRGLLAETRATFTLSTDAAPAARMEGRMEFILPEGCTVTGAALDVNGAMRPASVTRPRTARKAYDAVVSRMLDPCLVQLLPQGRVRVQVFPFTGGKPRQLRLEFAQMLKPGGVWELPFTLPEAVSVTVITDPPLTVSVKSEIRGGREVSMPVPDKSDNPLPAHPDGAGHWRFQLPLPPGERLEAPKHLLIVADISLLQSGRDAAAERDVLKEIIQKMQNGRVTLVTFSTVMHGTTTFEVSGGNGEDLFRALDGLTFDGAPRPRVVDASTIPADLTLVISTLTTPMGGSERPALPPGAPVWIMDSVSFEPTAAARRLAAETGGYAFHPRHRAKLFLTRRPAVSGASLAGLHYQALPGGAILLTGELTAAEADLMLDGKTVRVFRGSDMTAGRLLANQAARTQFPRPAASRSSSLPPDSASAGVLPCLTEDTAFIVLEEPWQYLQFGIPLPPDLKPASLEEPVSRTPGMEIFDRELSRTAGTRGNDFHWLAQMANYTKMRRWSERLSNLGKFRTVRESDDGEAGPESGLFRAQPWWPQLNRLRDQRTRDLPLLAQRFAEAPDADKPDMIRQARELQGTRAAEIPLIESTLGPVYSSGEAPFDLLRAAEWDFTRLSGGAADPFAGAADSFAGAADSFASADGMGAGGGWGRGSGSLDPLLSASAPPGPERIPEKRAKPVALPDTTQIITRAASLWDQGRRAEAIRALTSLALSDPDKVELLFLLAWKLEEWNEPGLAREVLEHIRLTHGFPEAVAWHLARLDLAAGNKAEAATQFREAKHDTALRDLAALEGRQSAAFRVIMECAGPDIDADLEIEGPDLEVCSAENPLPAFGGALSFDARSPGPEDFVLPAAPASPLTVRVRLPAPYPVPVRVTIIHNWGRPAETRKVIILPAAAPGVTTVTDG